MAKDIHAESFDESTQIKLHILREYIKSWLPVFFSNQKMNWKKIFIYDFFSGPGKDKTGVDGSPLIILKELRNYCEVVKEKQMLFDVFFNDMNSKKIDDLSDNIKKFRAIECSPTCSDKCVYNVTLKSDDFCKIFDRKYDFISNNSTWPHLVFLDQNGFKYITNDVFDKMTSLNRCDFIFFISSSHYRRFADVPQFQKYLKMNGEVFDEAQPYQCHRLIFQYYKNLLPSGKEYYLAPFSIKKGSSIHGLIFGSNHTLGIEKFLKIGWNINPQTGDANFDIDDEKINPERPFLFPDFNRANKLKRFENDLRNDIINGTLKTNKQSYLYALNSGFLPKHVNFVFKNMIKDGVLKDGFKKPTEKIHKIEEMALILRK